MTPNRALPGGAQNQNQVAMFENWTFYRRQYKHKLRKSQNPKSRSHQLYMRPFWSEKHPKGPSHSLRRIARISGPTKNHALLLRKGNILALQGFQEETEDIPRNTDTSKYMATSTKSLDTFSLWFETLASGDTLRLMINKNSGSFRVALYFNNSLHSEQVFPTLHEAETWGYKLHSVIMQDEIAGALLGYNEEVLDRMTDAVGK